MAVAAAAESHARPARPAPPRARALAARSSAAAPAERLAITAVKLRDAARARPPISIRRSKALVMPPLCARDHARAACFSPAARTAPTQAPCSAAGRPLLARLISGLQGLQGWATTARFSRRPNGVYLASLDSMSSTPCELVGRLAEESRSTRTAASRATARPGRGPAPRPIRIKCMCRASVIHKMIRKQVCHTHTHKARRRRA